jgi:hypothetical protein
VNHESLAIDKDAVSGNSGRANKHVLYGLPCAHCRAYYDAALSACPICRCLDRISPTVGSRVLRQETSVGTNCVNAHRAI